MLYTIKMENERYFATGQERKALISDKTAKAEKFVERSKEKSMSTIQYNFLDSSLDGNFGGTFFQSFKNVLPKEAQPKGLKAYIEHVLEAKKGEAVGIEFGGTGLKLFKDFTPGFFKQSFGVTLLDYRTPTTQMPSTSESTHQVIESNILDPELYTSLETKLEGKKFDFILERMAGGLRFIPAEPYKISGIFQRWYTSLATDGLLLVQSPMVFDKLMKKWVTLIKEEYPEVLDVEYESGAGDNILPGCVFRL